MKQHRVLDDRCHESHFENPPLSSRASTIRSLPKPLLELPLIMMRPKLMNKCRGIADGGARRVESVVWNLCPHPHLGSANRRGGLEGLLG